MPVFSGQDGTAVGDSSLVGVVLYAGRSAAGRRIATVHVTASAGSWSVRWPKHLSPGTYTVRAVHSDDAGHTSRSPSHTFSIGPQPNTIGSTVSLVGDTLTVAIACRDRHGEVCTGIVLILTAGSFQPVAGGPAGPLRLMFAWVSVPAGQTLSVRRGVTPVVIRALRGDTRPPVLVTAELTDRAGQRTVAHATRVLAGVPR